VRRVHREAQEFPLASFTTDYLYLLDQSGNSDNGKIVRQLLPNSQGTSTESNADGTLHPNETFTSTFSHPHTQSTYGGFTFTYIGQDPQFPGVVASDSFGNFYLISNDGSFQHNDNLNGIVATDVVICFLAGTMIMCPGGERAVETLAVGDLVLTADGRAVPVKWIGRQTVVTLFGPPEGRRPVCVAADALADGVPSRDLRLTADHALLIDDVLVHAGALVNGWTIRRIPLEEVGGCFMVFHIETENHEVIVAEGTPAETFIDNTTRRRFDNFSEYEAAYGTESGMIEELPLPRAMSARQVPPSVRTRIVRRAAALGQRSPNAA